MKARSDLVRDIMLGTKISILAEVMLTPFLERIKMSTISHYDETTYPLEHLGKFASCMRLYGVHEHIL